MTASVRPERRRVIRAWLAGLGLVLAGCGSVPPVATSTPAPTVSPSAEDVMALEPFASLAPGAYFIDPDGDRSTPMHVVYDIPADGWSQWIGTAKFSEAGHTGVSITTVANLVRHGCTDHAWADPVVGPGVDDLVAGMAALEPFEVASSGGDVTLSGFSGTHLAWTVPDLPGERVGDDWSFAGCVGGKLKSWVAFVDQHEPGDAFYGYTGPGYEEEFWILDVEGTRLLIAAGRSPGSPAEDLAEQQAILDSIRIVP